MTERNSTFCFCACAIFFCVAAYLSVAGTLMKLGNDADSATATLNATFVKVDDCDAKCSESTDYGTSCYQNFMCDVAWNYTNETYIERHKTLRWDSLRLTCDDIVAGANLTAVIEIRHPNVSIDLQPIGFVYQSALTTAGQSMLILAAILAGLFLISFCCQVVCTNCDRCSYSKI